MGLWAYLNTFNAGELSPRMQGRTDVSQYSKGCQRLENFFVTPYGAVERRPGTRFVAAAKTDGPVRLVRFAFSSNVAYVLEFGEYYIRFIWDGKQILSGDLPLEVTTPYSSSDLAALKFVQSADVMTVVHPDHPVYELRRTGIEQFEFIEKKYEYPPVLEPNLDDDFTLTPSGTLTAGGTVTLTASKDLFVAGHTGAYFQLVHSRNSNEISIDFAADGTSESLEVYGYWTFTSHGTWTGNLTIQRSFDGGASWTDYRTYSSAKDSNTSTSGTEEGDSVLYRLQMTDYEASSTGTLRKCRCLLVNPDFYVTGVVRLTAVTDARTATGTVIRKIGGTEATAEWNEGAFSDHRGYPCSIAFYEERMMLGGTASRPQTVWGSRTNDWDNYLLGDKDDSGLEFTLASDTVNTIQWMCSQDSGLIIGTMDSEWTLTASAGDDALTPTNHKARRRSVYGTGSCTAQMAGEVILFVQRGSRKIREFVYSYEKDGYNAPDMTILADHITAPGVKETALQQLPDTVLWCVLTNGGVSLLTYERDQEVVGWQRFVTSGSVISIAVIPAGDEDRVYLAVDRDGHVYLEELQSRKFSGMAECFFVDSGIRIESAEPVLHVTGLDHLEGKTVQVLGDGAVQREKVVTEGSITLDSASRVVIAGLGFESYLVPMPIEVDTENGSSSLRRKSIGQLRIRVYNSVGGKAKAGSGEWQQIISRDGLFDDLDCAIREKSEVVRINTLGGFEDMTQIAVMQSDPLPLNISTIAVNYELHE